MPSLFPRDPWGLVTISLSLCPREATAGALQGLPKHRRGCARPGRRWDPPRDAAEPAPARQRTPLGRGAWKRDPIPETRTLTTCRRPPLPQPGALFPCEMQRRSRASAPSPTRALTPRFTRAIRSRPLPVSQTGWCPTFFLLSSASSSVCEKTHSSLQRDLGLDADVLKCVLPYYKVYFTYTFIFFLEMAHAHKLCCLWSEFKLERRHPGHGTQPWPAGSRGFCFFSKKRGTCSRPR